MATPTNLHIGMNLQDRLNRLTPGAKEASLGAVVYDLINSMNNLVSVLLAGNTITPAQQAALTNYSGNLATVTVLLPEQRQPIV